MVKSSESTDPALLSALQVVIGESGVLTTIAAREYASSDVYRQGELPELVIRPGSIEALAKSVRIIADANFAIVVRGGGASYTDAYLPTSTRCVSVDMRSLDRVVSIDEKNATVTVEAGCTWARLHEALLQRGLRTPFFGPFSGLAATVGGAVSQHAVSHGSGRYGASADSVLSMDVVLADGSLLSTGSGSLASPGDHKRRFFRHNGPDLTGLFCGDCGALGIKSTVTLPVIKLAAATEALAFAFPSFETLHKAMFEVAKLAVDDENFGLDIALQQGQLARNEAAATQLKLAWQVFKGAPSWLKGAGYVTRMALAGSRYLAKPGYSVSYIVKGPNSGAARASAAAIRDAALKHGNEVPNTIPRVVASMPFAPLHNVLGPNGERWVPIHGILQHSDVVNFHGQFQILLERYRERSEAAGVWTGAMFQTIGSTAFLYEIAFYWPDELNAYHQQTLDPDFLSQIPRHQANPDAAALVEALKSEAIALFAEFGAVHLQLGKVYPYADRLEQVPVDLLRAIKQTLDPHGLMNPGALGL